MFSHRFTAALALSAVALPAAAAENTYLLGNSLTAGMRLPQYVSDLTETSANPDWFVDEFTSPGTTLAALRFEFESRIRPEIDRLDGSWDSVVFQPYDRMIVDPKAYTDDPARQRQPDWGDANNISGILNWFDEAGSDPTVYVYAHFPRITPGAVRTADAEARRDELLADYANYDFGEQYGQAYTNPTQIRNFETRDYFTQLVGAVREQEPDREVFLVPFGDVLDAIDDAAEAGEFADFTDVKELFVDQRHLQGGLAQYVKAATFYATIVGQDLDALEWERYNNAADWENFYANRDFYGNGTFRGLDQGTVDFLNDLILDVVTSDPSLTGVIPEPATAGLMAVAGLALLRRRRSA